MKRVLTNHKIQFKLILALILGVIVTSIIYYFLIPTILNYPEGTYGTNFQQELENANYFIQVLLITVVIFAIFTSVTLLKTGFLVKYNDIFDNPKKYSNKEIDYVRNKLFTVPNSIFILNIVIPSIALTVIHILTINQIEITTLKLFILVLFLMTLLDTAIYIYTCNLFRSLLAKLPYRENIDVKRATIKKRIFFNIMPLITVSILFTSILGYSLFSTKTGDYLFENYQNSLYYLKEYNDFSSIEELLKKSKSIKLLNENDFVFVRTQNNQYLNQAGEKIEVSKFFDKYLNEFSMQNGGRVYEYYGIDCQGAIINIDINGKNYIVGVYYNIIDLSVLTTFTIAFIVLVLLNIIILILFSKNLSNDINIISENFMEIANNKDIKSISQLPITSNDEFCDLINSFNDIQKLTNDYITEIDQKQEIMQRQAQFAILGEFAGGMAHDINNPASAVNMSIDVLYNVDDKEKKKEILDNMKECVKRILAIVSSVRDQFRNLGDTKKQIFNLKEVLQNIEIVIHNQLSKYKCTLAINYMKNCEVYGEKNKLNQVLSNIIMNAILAYKDNGKSGKITVDIEEEEGYNIIKISDEAGGIPEKVRDSLFTKIITTRGTQGTGLGLYLAKSIIEDEFNGKIYFETETGKGTTFYIKLKKVEG